MALRFPAERMITLAKTNTLQNAMQLSRKYLREKEVVFKLLSVLKLRYLFRNGGYTRVHKCGFRKYDKAPMAYIELVDSPTEIGKRIEKRPKVYPTIEELREKAPTMDIYNKPVVHVSENKRTSLLGGMVTLLSRLRAIPIPTVSDIASNLLTPPDLSVEFSNLPGPGQPREKEAHEKVAQNVLDIKKHANEVLERRKQERKDERARLRKLLRMDGTKKKLKAAKAAAAAKAAKPAEGKTEGTAAEGNAAEGKATAEGKGKEEGKVKEIKTGAQEKRTHQPQANKSRTNQKGKQQKHAQAKQHPHAKPQGKQQQHKKNKNNNKKQGKKK
eukprot:Phypoly_transcript_04665.p1 GENE.Phypoly_transcript_04665~~Phypoly_transcript_04665.p1  ORF type:complete len:382 (-),score=93.91 Phypoly_transcript_04665:986-1972(-)